MPPTAKDDDKEYPTYKALGYLVIPGLRTKY